VVAQVVHELRFAADFDPYCRTTSLGTSERPDYPSDSFRPDAGTFARDAVDDAAPGALG
jgi:hypothetical protein